MSAQLKSGNVAVRFLLKHGEKLGIALLLGCAALLIYSSLGRERLGAEKQPERLRTNATQADEKVRNMSWTDLPEEEQIIAAKATVRGGDAVVKPVPPAAFPVWEAPLDTPVIRPMKLREDPVLLPVADLEVTGGSGLWASDDPEAIRRRIIEQFEKSEEERREQQRRQERMAEEGNFGRGGGERGFDGAMAGQLGANISGKTDSGGLIIRPRGGAQTQGFETIKSRSWVTVVAKVPYQAQVNLYEDALEEARGFNPQRDMPEYPGYIVQRAEVTDEGLGDWEEIARVADQYIIKKVETWPVDTPEVVNQKYVHPRLTFPLPPMVLREWGEDVTHSEMPLPTPEDLLQPYGDEAFPEGENDGPEVDPDSPWALPERGGRGAPGGRFEEGGRRGMPPVAGRRGEGMGRAPMGGRGGYGAEMRGGEMMGMGDMEMGLGVGMMEGGRGGYGGYGRAGSTGMVQLPEYQWDGETSLLLFRFFDTTVDPGRRYRYRVRLVVRDVNDKVPARYLQPEVISRRDEQKGGFRFTDWSEPSRVASVPLPGLIFIAGAEQANERNFNDEPEAELLIKSLDEQYAAEVAVAEKFARGSVVNLRGNAKIIVSRQFRLEEGEKEPEFDFHTGMTLLDFDGGERIRRRDLTAPARALLMDSAGRLMRQTEWEDQETVEEYRNLVEAAEASGRGRGGGGRGGRGGEEFGGFGGFGER